MPALLTIADICRHYNVSRSTVYRLRDRNELGLADDIFAKPAHPYTHALISAVPVPDITKLRSRHRVV